MADPSISHLLSNSPDNLSMNQNTVPTDLKSRMKSSYDAIAPTYKAQFTVEDDPVRLDYLSRLLSSMRNAHITTGAVLELGCGAGIPATKYLLDSQDPRLHITGNDLSTGQLNLLRENLASYLQDGENKRLTVVQGDMLSLFYPEKSFDAIVACYSIIHLPRAEQKQLMSKIATWLKPGGWFLGNFTSKEEPALEHEKWLDHEQGWMFWSGWGVKGSVEMMKEVGLKIETQELRQAINDAEFVWVFAKKEGDGG